MKAASKVPTVTPPPASVAPAAHLESAVHVKAAGAVRSEEPRAEEPRTEEARAEEVRAEEVPEGATVEQPVEVEDEHRASKRISISVELHLASDSHFFSGLSGDISEGGVFVSTYRPLAQGSLVDLEFSLPGSDHPLRARGEVRWHRDATPDVPPGVGISFDELSEDDRKIIHRFCTMRPPLYYDDVG
jgi:type IV pilus assembly protein PilZ